jgi:hypothetical protein
MFALMVWIVESVQAGIIVSSSALSFSASNLKLPPAKALDPLASYLRTLFSILYHLLSVSGSLLSVICQLFFLDYSRDSSVRKQNRSHL